jgi:hypothetical protein
MEPKAVYFGKSDMPLKFYQLAEYPGPVRFTVGYDDDQGEHHLLGDGILTVDKTEGSYAYGPELQIHLRFTTQLKEKLERAVNNGHDRIEICMSEAEGINFLYDALVSFQKLPTGSAGNTTSKARTKVEDFL